MSELVESIPSTAISGVEGNLALDSILQKWVMCVIGDKIEGQFVRPRWQYVEAGYPDIGVTWCSFATRESNPDCSATVLYKNKQAVSFRHEELQVVFSFFGQNGWELACDLRDGLELWQNRLILLQNNMDVIVVERMDRIPELVNQQWQNRVDLTIRLRRNSVRQFTMDTITSVKVNINGEVNRNGSWIEC